MNRFGNRRRTAAAVTGALAAATATAGHAAPAADLVLRNGAVYTADKDDSVRQAVAVRSGRIVYVGTSRGALAFIGAKTRIVDLKGHMLMPGLIDGHLHPLTGGSLLRSCNLEYRSLTEAEFLSRIQACLDSSPDAPADEFLQVDGWYRQYMRPKGIDPSRDTLDKLNTRRPIMVANRDRHSYLVNSRALEFAGVTDSTPNPAGGSIARDSNGRATGILEDAAADLVRRKMPARTADDALKDAEAAMTALSAAGVTSMLDAAATEGSLETYNQLRVAGKLTIRTHVALLVDTVSSRNPGETVAGLVRVRDRFDEPQIRSEPGLRVHTAKLFMDGVIQAPAQTAGLVEPYWVNMGANGHAHWQPGMHRGSIYIDQGTLERIVVDLAQAGIDPHIHAIGDRAAKLSLDALAKLRKAVPDDRIRPAIAHAELIEPIDYARFQSLGVTPVMSYQWSIPGPNSVTGAKPYLGTERFERMEPFDKLDAAGVRVAYGSDWPVDRMNYWLALKAGITRAGDKDSIGEFGGRLNHAPGLSRKAALRSITINSAWALHQEKDTGSVEVGKLADLIVLDHNFLTAPEAELADNKVLLTLVGGKVVYEDGALAK